MFRTFYRKALGRLPSQLFHRIASASVPSVSASIRSKLFSMGFGAGVGLATAILSVDAAGSKQIEADIATKAPVTAAHSAQTLEVSTVPPAASTSAITNDFDDDDVKHHSRNVYVSLSNPGTSDEFGDRVKDVLEINLVSGLSIQIALAPLGQGDPNTKQFSLAHHFNMGKNEAGEDYSVYEFNANLALWKHLMLQGKYSSSGPGVQGVIRNTALDERLTTQLDFMVSNNPDFNFAHPHVIYKGSDYTTEFQYSGRDQVALASYIQNLREGWAVSADLLHTFHVHRTFLALGTRVKTDEETYLVKYQPGSQAVVLSYARHVRDSPFTLASEYTLSIPDHQSTLRGGFMCRFGDNPGLPTARATIDTNLHLQSTLELPVGEQVQLGFCADVNYIENKSNFGFMVAFQT